MPTVDRGAPPASRQPNGSGDNLGLAFGGSVQMQASRRRLRRQARVTDEQGHTRFGHAIGKNGSSPHPAAPSFRDLSRRVDLDRFALQLRDGLTSGHPDMPTFRFMRERGAVP